MTSSALPRCPRLAADVIVAEPARGVLLIRRRNPPLGWALPGGFVELGETVEATAMRELTEETGVVAESISQFRVYSDLSRDPRGHTVAVVFVARVWGEPHGGSDASEAQYFPWDGLPKLAFDHATILADYRCDGGGIS